MRRNVRPHSLPCLRKPIAKVHLKTAVLFSRKDIGVRNHVAGTLRLMKATGHPGLIWEEVSKEIPVVDDQQAKIAKIDVVQGMLVTTWMPLVPFFLFFALLGF